MPETLASEKNPLLKEVRRAVSRGSLTKDGFAISEGFHLLKEALRSRREIAAVIAAANVNAESLGRLPQETRRLTVSEPVFDRLASTETPQGILALVRPPVWSLDHLLREPCLIVVIDGIQDPGNAGAIVRAAEAFRATGIVFLKSSVNPYNPKAMRASAGSVFRVPMVAGVEAGALAAELRRKSVRIYSAVPRAEQPFSSIDLTEPCAIAIGSEGRGVGEILQRVSVAARIPTCGVESLNASVAAGVILYEASRQRAKCNEPV